MVASSANAQLGENEVIESEAKKLSASIAQSESANALRRLAEAEFEKRFSAICAIAHETIKIGKSAMLNSPFLKRIVEKINTKKPGAIEIIDEEKSDLVANGAIVQLGENEANETETKNLSASIAQPDSANALRRFAEKEFEKQLSAICTIAHETTKQKFGKISLKTD